MRSWQASVESVRIHAAKLSLACREARNWLSTAWKSAVVPQPLQDDAIERMQIMSFAKLTISILTLAMLLFILLPKLSWGEDRPRLAPRSAACDCGLDGRPMSWETHPDNPGHYYFLGCFRCHDGQHMSSDGKVISKDCHTGGSSP
jgi:hypothetical protein